ncbi:LysR family transcriptional regulator [Brevibacillus centrosporus]|uniref:DNA-binding transcriptional regulator, LysR family n=1 Tax=Brevibacillus centrosporus TaxID=54910 RepID=A0A1I3MIK3_9BACL|nr:LysR substrate-binding domain-containing protein [Brevibacillus centrosporus]MED4911845.1 LysR substrate-binding domain-containing protein [Brevibacillus centrosporus]SFI96813.1 DNA-binding transcriptional regulator, LysR family [Brevibacillus centrosporus]
MELRQLQYFLTLCSELHFSEAAFKLGISQPTLSQQIRVLEDEIGVPLFDRIGKKTLKTEAGAILEHYALEIFQKLENAKSAIADLTDLHAGHLRVAVLASDLDYRFTSLLVDFHKEFPQTKVQMIPSIKIVEKVLDNVVDIGVGLAFKTDSRLNRIPFYTETYSLYVHEDHELANHAQVDPQELVDLPFVMYPTGFYGRNLIDTWCQENGITIATILETGSATSLLQLVHEGVGATIQPSELITSFRSLRIRAIPIRNSPVRELEIYYRNDKYVSKAATAFMRKLEDYFHRPV